MEKIILARNQNINNESKINPIMDLDVLELTKNYY